MIWIEDYREKLKVYKEHLYGQGGQAKFPHSD